MENGLHRTIDWRSSICPRFRERAGRRRLRFNLNGIIHLSRIGSDLFLLTRNSLVICANGITGRERSHFTLPSPFFPNSITRSGAEWNSPLRRTKWAWSDSRVTRETTSYRLRFSNLLTSLQFREIVVQRSHPRCETSVSHREYFSACSMHFANSRAENSIHGVHVSRFWKIVRNESADGCKEHAASSFNNLHRPTRDIADCLINRLRIGWLWSSSIDVG